MWGQTEEARGTRLALILKTIENHWRFMRKEVWRAVRGRNWSGGETEEGENPDPNERSLSKSLRIPVSHLPPVLLWSVLCAHEKRSSTTHSREV